MKPKRPSEADLLNLIQNGFNSQLPRDRETQAPAPALASRPKAGDLHAGEPASRVPMVRITLTVPEDLRYRLKVAVLSHRRTSLPRMTQDEYCARAIGAQLDLDEGADDPGDTVVELVAFLRECMREGALAEAWEPKARAILSGISEAGR